MHSSYHFCLSVASAFAVIVDVFWTLFVCWLVAKMLNHFRRLINKFILNKDFLVLSLNVSLSLTTFWGIFVWIILSSFVELRKKFIISALCVRKAKRRKVKFFNEFISSLKRMRNEWDFDENIRREFYEWAGE